MGITYPMPTPTIKAIKTAVIKIFVDCISSFPSKCLIAELKSFMLMKWACAYLFQRYTSELTYPKRKCLVCGKDAGDIPPETSIFSQSYCARALIIFS
jgi:hypothetical protein